MGTFKDLTGMRYGLLTVAEKVGPNSRGLMQWLCTCDCGGTAVAVSGNLNSGNTTSCGCLRRKALDKRNHVDLVGQHFGRLMVVERLFSNKNDHVVWLCTCECGGNANVTTGNLTKSNTRSCGCLQREAASIMGLSCKQENPVSNTPEYRREGQRRRLQDPKTRLRRRLSWHIRRAINNVGSAKGGKTFDLLGYGPSDLARHIERQFAKGMGWHNANEWDIDHIIPISTARTLDDVIALNQMSNLRPMWREENNAKRAKVMFLL